MSVDVDKATGILIDKMANKNTPSITARDYKQETGETAKPLFIGIHRFEIRSPPPITRYDKERNEIIPSLLLLTLTVVSWYFQACG